MNALELLKNDHEKVSGILERLDQTTERAQKTREDQYARLRDEIDTHSYIEETVFYPALADDSRTHSLTVRAYEEHRIVKSLLEEMDTIPVDSEQWTAKLKMLKSSVEQHVQEEEKEIFPQARQVLTKAQLDELGEQLEQAKLTEADERLAEPRATAALETRQGRGEGREGRQGRQARGQQRRGGRQERLNVSVHLGCPGFGFIRRICP